MTIRALFASALAAALAACMPAAAEQAPATFPHSTHVVDQGMKCTDCHTLAADSQVADDNLNPDPQVCQDCHEADSVALPKAAPARELRFSHRFHLNTAKLECHRCHAGVLAEGGAAQPLPAMSDCMSCHNGSAATRECAACHTAERSSLRPASHQVGWMQEHGRQARMSDSTCMPCHSVDSCQECHDGAMLLSLDGQLGTRDTPMAPELEGGKGMTLQRVHGLNYRFLHALDARGKRSDCAVCHDVENGNFCAECHNPTADPSIRPVWHGGPNWGALAGGVGTGGGRHAEMARRDMESCVACHDTQGNDPTCLMCHMDRTPGKGNDPRTHSASFAGDLGEGDWHNDSGAACFTCHIRHDRRDPQGLCGYCHSVH